MKKIDFFGCQIISVKILKQNLNYINTGNELEKLSGEKDEENVKAKVKFAMKI